MQFSMISLSNERMKHTSLSTLHSSLEMVGLGGLEPPTSRLSGVRSNHLSYKPKKRMVEMRRVELLTPCLQGRCSPN